MTTVCLALIPRDGVFFKDGRGWFTSSLGRGHGLDWPWPSTIQGALRTAWGRRQETHAGRPLRAAEWRERTASVHLGRSLAIRRPCGGQADLWQRVWRKPLDAAIFPESGLVVPLDPRPPAAPTLGRDDDPARERLWAPVLPYATKPLEQPSWWGELQFANWLAADAVRRDELCRIGLARRVQTHVGIREAELTTDEGMLFSHDVMETLERAQAADGIVEWGIGVELSIPGEAKLDLATLGSDRRLAAIEEVPPALFDPPQGVMRAFRSGCKGFRLIVVTPALFSEGWLFDGFRSEDGEFRGALRGAESELILRAAIVPRPLHVSGWDMAAKEGRGAPKPTSRLVPAGAVYFFERADGKVIDENDARSLWLSAHGARTEDGFGRVVPGVWNPRGEK